jgi:hypothetical protein
MWSEAITEFFKFVNNLFTGPRGQIKKVVNIYDAMHRILDETSVKRCIIYKAHNGGVLIRPHTPLYISALYEDYSHPFNSVKADYQRLELDEEGLRVLSELSLGKKFAAYTEDLKPGLMKGIYLAEGIKYCELYYLGQDKKNVYFCSCATSDEMIWSVNPTDKNIVDMCVNIIRNNIK